MVGMRIWIWSIQFNFHIICQIFHKNECKDSNDIIEIYFSLAKFPKHEMLAKGTTMVEENLDKRYLGFLIYKPMFIL